MKKLISTLCGVFLLLAIIPSTVLPQDTKPPLVVSSYSATVKIGEKFIYKIEVKMPMPTVNMTFKLLKGPEGMLVDPKEGIVTWTPIVKGEFGAEIEVYSNNIKVGTSLIKLKVVEMLGTISGTVTNDDGKALQYILIMIGKNVASSTKPDSFTPMSYCYTDANGKYVSSNLEPGTYFIHAETNMKDPMIKNNYQTYLPVWYVDSPTFDKAKGVLIDQANPKFEANLKMHINPNIPVTTYSFAFTILKNQPFTFQIPIPMLMNPLPTEFILLKPLSTLSVDKDKGIVTWTPTETGEFSTQIGVYNGMNGNKKIFANVILKFKVAGFLGTVKGNVKADDGSPLQNVMVTLYKKISVSQKGETYSNSLYTLTDDKGNYSIEKVGAGSYFVYARTAFEKTLPPVPIPTVSYSPVWYKDSSTIDKADPIEITELNKAVTADLTMHKFIKQEPKIFTISGKVLSGSTPVANAIILASMSGKNVTGSVFPDDGTGLMCVAVPTLGLFTDIFSKAVTDKEGNYKLQVNGGTSFIIACYAEGFQLQYYNGKSNILEADKLSPDKDLSGIDFKLTPLPAAKGKIGGKVVDETKSIVTGKAVLFSANASTPINLLSRTVNTNDGGEFIFEKVPDGKYYLQVIPSKGYMPAYYKLNDCGIREPKKADLIVVQNEGSISGLVVCVKKVTSNGGGKVSGNVNDANGKGIGGVIVISESKNLDECSFGITENDGSYEISGLGVNSYSITCEKYGYNSLSGETAIIDYANNSFNSTVNLFMNNTTVTNVEDNFAIPVQFSLGQNYPNPFNPTTVISYQLPVNSKVLLRIFDLLGREVAELVNEEKTAGRYEVKFDASNISSGVYFYRISAGNFIATKKLVVMK